MGRIEEARDSLIQARNINSNDSKLHLLLGEVYLKLGMRAEAYREHETLSQLDHALAEAFAKLLNAPS